MAKLSSSSIRKIIDHADQKCRESGAQLTIKRSQLLRSLVQADKAMTAYELVDYYKELFDESLPAMSVYRILDFLEKERLVHKLALANRYVACTHIACDHQHEVSQFFICSKCSRVEEVNIGKSMISTLRREVDAAGFQLANQQLEISCVCKTCT